MIKRSLFIILTLGLSQLAGFAQTNAKSVDKKEAERAIRDQSRTRTQADVNQTSTFTNTPNTSNPVNTSGKTTKSKKPVVEVGSKEYQDLKAKGLLAHYEFKITESGLVPVPGNTYVNKNASTTTSSLTPCDWPSVQGIQPWSGSPTDDATSGLLPLPFNFCFYGTNYTQCRVSTNGNIQFPPTNNTGFTSTGFPTATDRMIAPFWGDVDIRGGGRVYYDIYATYAVFSWDSVGYYNTHPNLRNSFQCVITDGTDPILPPGKNVGFYFKNMQWTTGDASGGTGGFPATQPGSPAMVGANAGNGVDYFVIGRFGVPGSVYDGPGGNSDGISWLNHKSFFFNICPPVGGNQEPISTLIGYCDTMKVCGNDTLYVKNTWISPETTQTVSATASAPTLGSSFSYSTVVNGSSTDIYMVINANTAQAGYHIVTMTATDNGTPPLSSTLNYVVYVNQNAVNSLNGVVVVTPTTGACPGSTVSASVNLSGTPDSYLWSNNASTASTTFTTIIPADSAIFVTLTSGQCKKTLTGEININPTPVAAILGNLSLCSGSIPTTVLTATNTLNPAQQAPYTYAWSSAGGPSSTLPPPTQTITVNEGVYTVTVTNKYGCTSSATATVVLNEGPSYVLNSANAVSDGSVYCVSQDTARIGFTYLTAAAPQCGLGNLTCTSPSLVVVGLGNTTSNASSVGPMISFWESSHHQYIYTASELQSAGVQAGKISSLAFNISNLGTVTNYPGFTIKMKCTQAADFSSSSFDNSFLTQVYTTSSTALTTGWNTFNFPQPYIWDGNSNILVDVCHDVVPFYTSSTFVCTTTSFYSTAADYDDGAGSLCGSNNSPVTGVVRPDVRLGNCLAVQEPSQFNVTITPSVGVVIPATKDSIIIDLPNISSITCYTVHVQNPIGGCSKDTVICINAQLPITNATFVASSNSVCAGQSVVLTASGADTYTMSYVQNGTPVPITYSSSTATVTPPMTGLNVYSLTAIGFCGAAPAGYTVGVYVTPVADLIITPLVDVAKCLNTYAILQTGVSSNMPGVNNGTPYTYQWTTLPGNNPAPGTSNGPTYQANSNSTQTIVVTVSGTCANPDRDTVVVTNIPNDIAVSIVDSVSMCADMPFMLHASATGGVPDYSYSWHMSPNTSSIGSGETLGYTTPGTEGNYIFSVTVSDSCGYMHTDYQVVNVLPPCNVIIPNVMTPNGDGTNDILIIKNIEHHPNTSLTVYDRWGRKIYENSNYQNDWRAEGLSDGTFFYIVDVPDDKTYNGYITIFHK